jgi:hypothetical protein
MEVGTYYRRGSTGGVPHAPLYYQVVEKLLNRFVAVVNLQSGAKYTLSENDMVFHGMEVMYESEMTMILLKELP